MTPAPGTLFDKTPVPHQKWPVPQTKNACQVMVLPQFSLTDWDLEELFTVKRLDADVSWSFIFHYWQQRTCWLSCPHYFEAEIVEKYLPDLSSLTTQRSEIGLGSWGTKIHIEMRTGHAGEGLEKVQPKSPLAPNCLWRCACLLLHVSYARYWNNPTDLEPHQEVQLQP